MGVKSSGPRKYFVLSTILNPKRKSAVAEKDCPNTFKTPSIYEGSPFIAKPPITPKSVINKIGFKMIDLSASNIKVFLFGPC